MLVSTSDTEIFALLERAGKDRFDMAKPLLFDFDFEDHFYFFLFCPGKEFRGAFLYCLPLLTLQFELRHELIPALIQLPDSAELAGLKNQALEHVESLLSGRKMDVGYFDAH